MNKLCERTQQRLAESLTIGPVEAIDEEVRQHVGQCSRCKAYAQALREDHDRLVRLVKAVEKRLPALEESVTQRLNSREPSSLRQPSSLWNRLTRGTRVPWAAAAVILLGVGLSIVLYSAHKTDRSAPAVATTAPPETKRQADQADLEVTINSLRAGPGTSAPANAISAAPVVSDVKDWQLQNVDHDAHYFDPLLKNLSPLVGTATSQPTAGETSGEPRDAQIRSVAIPAGPAVPVPPTGSEGSGAATSPEDKAIGAAAMRSCPGLKLHTDLHTRFRRQSDLAYRVSADRCVPAWHANNWIEVAVGRSPLVVRARVLGWTGPLIRYEVIRKLYGQLASNTVNVLYDDLRTDDDVVDAYRRTRQGASTIASDEHLILQLREHTEVGREVILCLQPARLHNSIGGFNSAYRQQSLGSSLYLRWDPPDRPSSDLDGEEAKVIEILELGTHLDPARWDERQLADHLFSLDCWAGETLIARAKLLEVGDLGARWQVIRILRGNPGADVVLVDHEEFRQRAEAVVHYRVRQASQTQPVDGQQIQSEIQDEMARMRRAELPDEAVGSEAILFLYECRPEDGALHCRLHERFYGITSPGELDKVEERIRKACEERSPVRQQDCGCILCWELSSAKK